MLFMYYTFCLAALSMTALFTQQFCKGLRQSWKEEDEQKDEMRRAAKEKERRDAKVIPFRGGAWRG